MDCESSAICSQCSPQRNLPAAHVDTNEKEARDICSGNEQNDCHRCKHDPKGARDLRTYDVIAERPYVDPEPRLGEKSSSVDVWIVSDHAASQTIELAKGLFDTRTGLHQAYRREYVIVKRRIGRIEMKRYPQLRFHFGKLSAGG